MPSVPRFDGLSKEIGSSLSRSGGEIQIDGSTWRLHKGGGSIDWVSPPAVLQHFIAELFASTPKDVLSWVHSAAWRLREESWQGPVSREKGDFLANELAKHQIPNDTWERGVPNEKEETAARLKVHSLSLRTAQAGSMETAPLQEMKRRSCLRATSPRLLVPEDAMEKYSSGKNSGRLRPLSASVNVESEMIGHGSGNHALAGYSSHITHKHTQSTIDLTPMAKRCSMGGVDQLEFYEVPSSDERDSGHSTRITGYSSGLHKITTVTNDSMSGTTDAREFLKNFTVYGKKQNSIRSTMSNMQNLNQDWTALSPTTWPSFSWTGVFTICFFLELWVLPIELIFFRNELPSWHRASDIFFLCFFTLDILMSCVTGYRSNGVLYTEWPSTLFRYMRRWMWLDAIATIPYLVCIIFDDEDIKSVRLVIVLRVARLHRVRKWIALVPLFLPRLRPLAPLTKLQISLLFLVHTFAVIFALLQPSHWVEQYPHGPYGCYLQALRWSFVAITLGSTPQTADHFNQIVWDLLVSICRIVFFLVILEWNKTHSLFRFSRRSGTAGARENVLDENQLSAYLSSRSVHPSLQIEVMDALGEIEDSQRDQSGRARVTSQIIDSELRHALKQCMWEWKIETLGIMAPLVQWQSTFVVELADFVEEVVLPPGAILFASGDPTLTAYFILMGTLGVVTLPGEKLVADYTQGMWVGEQALLNPELLHKESMYCRSRTELMAVHAKDFRALLMEHDLADPYQRFLQETLWMGFCGRCGLFGDHFSKDCPLLEENSWKAAISSIKAIGSPGVRRPNRSMKYKNELMKLLSDHGLANMAAELHRYAIKNVNDLNTAAFDDFLDDEDTGTLRQDKEKLRKAVDRIKKKAVEGTAALMNTTAADDHFIFISHYKAEAGTEATLMQRDLEGLIIRDRLFPNQDIVSPVFVDSENLTNLADLQASVLRSYNVVVLLTPGVLTRPWVLVEISLAFRHEINVIPVEVQRPNLKFTYPDEAYLKSIGTGEKLDAQCKDLLSNEGILLSDLEAALRQLFKLIALRFSPHMSNSIRDAELQDVIKRCNLKRPQSMPWSSSQTPATKVHPVVSKSPKPQSASPTRNAHAMGSPTMGPTRSMAPSKGNRDENRVDTGHGHVLSLAASQAMDRVKLQRQSNQLDFKVGDRVIVTKESRTKGRIATVVDENWNGLVKVDMDEEDEKGKTKTFKPTELIHVSEPKENQVVEVPTFQVGDRVRIIKESRTKGKTAVVVEPNWHDLVKVTMDVPDDKGATKSFKLADLEFIGQPDSLDHSYALVTSLFDSSK